MQTFKKTCAQGDIFFRRIDKMPEEELVEFKVESGNYVVAHSETGHHHVMDAGTCTVYDMPKKTLPEAITECLLVVDQPTKLEHLRSVDTHEPILFDKGIFIGRRQREYTPEGLRRVED